jgi:hypothetical protein
MHELMGARAAASWHGGVHRRPVWPSVTVGYLRPTAVDSALNVGPLHVGGEAADSEPASDPSSSEAVPHEAVGLAAWDLAASGLMWVHTLPPRGSAASQNAGSAFARHLGRRPTPQVLPNEAGLL